jgi:hypothetical protein
MSVLLDVRSKETSSCSATTSVTADEIPFAASASRMWSMR